MFCQDGSVLNLKRHVFKRDSARVLEQCINGGGGGRSCAVQEGVYSSDRLCEGNQQRKMIESSLQELATMAKQKLPSRRKKALVVFEALAFEEDWNGMARSV